MSQLSSEYDFDRTRQIFKVGPKQRTLVGNFEKQLIFHCRIPYLQHCQHVKESLL